MAADDQPQAGHHADDQQNEDDQDQRRLPLRRLLDTPGLVHQGRCRLDRLLRQPAKLGDQQRSHRPAGRLPEQGVDLFQVVLEQSQ